MKTCNKKRNSFKKRTMIAFLGFLILLFNACSEEFLEQKPLSFYEPGATFSTESGLSAAMTACDNHLRALVLDAPVFHTEYMFSDIGVRGQTDNSSLLTDISTRLVPTSNLERVSWFWTEGYTGIKYANTVISSIDKVKGLDDRVKNAYLGRAYFHRAFRYLLLTFQFNNVPLVTKLLEVPKQNYYSIKREALIKMLIKDLEFAEEWVPHQSEMSSYGMVNKAACRMLLIKCYLADGQFAKAKSLADILIDDSGFELVQEGVNLGPFNPGGRPETWKITQNIIWDMHRPENKLKPANTESIMGVVKRGAGDSFGSQVVFTRAFGPFWSGPLTKDLNGLKATETFARTNAKYNPELDFLYAIGRGVADIRPSYYATHTLWVVNGVEDNDDLRHNVAVGNWFTMDSMKYNDPSSNWYGKTFAEVPPDCSDTVRNYFNFPLYKVFMMDVQAINNLNNTGYYGATRGEGSVADWYVYRLAETYLLRAEANFYLGHPELAAKDVNEIRKRAKCSQLYVEDASFTIGDIMDERARELFIEEFRHAELARVSYCLALSGKPDEWGNTYNLDTYDKQEGIDNAGGSYWYQRIMHHNNFYISGNTGVSIAVNGNVFNYTINKRNLYWPVPNDAIKDNAIGQLFQNYGYDGYDPSIKMWEIWEEAVADEDRVE